MHRVSMNRIICRSLCGTTPRSRQRKILSVVSLTFSGFGCLRWKARSGITWNRSFACVVFQRKTAVVQPSTQDPVRRILDIFRTRLPEMESTVGYHLAWKLSCWVFQRKLLQWARIIFLDYNSAAVTPRMPMVVDATGPSASVPGSCPSVDERW